jgi:predicted dehydrogenase
MHASTGAGAARIAVVGAGLIGRRHIDALRRADGVALAAVIDPAGSAAEIAAAQGVPHFAQLEDLPNGLIDGVILATPNQTHLPLGLAALARRLPTLVEKPIAPSLTEAVALVTAAEQSGVPLLVGHHRRHNPRLVATRDMIAAGAVGQVLAAHGFFWVEKPAAYFETGWRSRAGAGPVFLNLIHDVDSLRFILGEIVAVQAVTRNSLRGHAVEDTAAIILEFASGAIGTFSLSDGVPSPWSWELSAGENPAYPALGQPCTYIGGTRGALEIPALRLWRHDGGAGWWSAMSATVEPCASADPLVRQAEQFGRVIAGVEAPLVSGQEGMRTLAVIEAIAEAARDMRRVETRT